MRRIAEGALTVAFLLMAATACGDTTVIAPVAPTPGLDRVVGIELRCTAHTTGDSSDRDIWGAMCMWNEATVVPEINDQSVAAIPGTTFSNRRKIVTVRTANGTAYTIAVPMTQAVALGDPWPPTP